MIISVQNMILHGVLIILGVYFAVTGLVHAQGFLIPITIAGLLAMLMLPIANSLEQWKVPRAVAAFVSIIVLLALTIGLNFLLVKEIQNFSGDIPQMMDTLQPKVERLKTYISEKTGVSPWEQEQQLKSLIQKRIDMLGSNALILVSNVQDFLQATLLVFVYTFFFYSVPKQVFPVYPPLYR